MATTSFVVIVVRCAWNISAPPSILIPWNYTLCNENVSKQYTPTKTFFTCQTQHIFYVFHAPTSKLCATDLVNSWARFDPSPPLGLDQLNINICVRAYAMIAQGPWMAWPRCVYAKVADGHPAPDLKYFEVLQCTCCSC